MKKILALTSSLLLVASLATPAQSATKYSVSQKTLAAFGSTATTLSAKQRAQVKAAVNSNPAAEKFICTGIRLKSAPMSENIKVRKRAKAACDYAKQLKPALSTFFQNKPTNARSYAGKVLLTVKSTLEPTVETAGICADENLTEPAARLCSVPNADVAFKAHTAMQQKVKAAQSTKEVKINLFISEALQSERKRFLAEAQSAADFHGNDFSGSEVQVMLFTPKDGPWASRTWAEITRGSIDELITIQRMQGGQAIARQHNGETRYYFVFVFDSAQASKGSAEFLIHEFTHLVQSSYAKSFFHGYPQVSMPVWLIEGAPTFVSTAPVPLKQAKQILVNRGVRPEVTDAIKARGKDAVLDFYKALETQNNSPDTSWKSYLFGGIASELIVASFGYQKLAKFQRSFADGSSVSGNFSSVFGFDIDLFYDRVADYALYLLGPKIG